MGKNNKILNTNKTLNSWKYLTGNKELLQENLEIIVEKSTELIINGTPLLSFFCSPIELEALTIGYLWNEHIIDHLDDILNLRISPDLTQIDVSISHFQNDGKKPTRTSSGMVVSGKNEIIHEKQSFTINPKTLIRLYDDFSEKQKLHKSAGGYHSAALSDGKLINIIVEDLGRHNCLDKISGKFLLEGRSFSPKLLFLSGRISSEMINKSLRLGVPLIATRTTPTVSAVEIAEANGITIVGYLRGSQFSTFTCPERLIF